MMPLGTRVVPEDITLEGRIAARLHEALERQVAAQAYAFDEERGLAVFGDIMDATTIVLTVEDVARIAAQEARSWF